MCALPAQRDLRQSGIRRAMKRHTTRFKILSTKKLLEICECEMCGKELKGRRGLTNHMEIRKNEKTILLHFLPTEILY